MGCRWAKTYLLMGHGGLIRIGKSIRFICIFFLDTPQIRIQDVSNEYRYRIRIQVSDTLWVEVSVFHSRSILHRKPKPKLVAFLFQLVPRATFHVLLVCTLDMSNNQHSVVPPTLLKSINQVLSNIASNYSVLF
jgi:hypothetical protein